MNDLEIKKAHFAINATFAKEAQLRKERRINSRDHADWITRMRRLEAGLDPGTMADLDRARMKVAEKEQRNHALCRQILRVVEEIRELYRIYSRELDGEIPSLEQIKNFDF